MSYTAAGFLPKITQNGKDITKQVQQTILQRYQEQQAVQQQSQQQSFLGGYGIYLLAAGGLVGLLWFIKRKKK